MSATLRLAIVASAVLALSACGGGGSGSTASSAPTVVALSDVTGVYTSGDDTVILASDNTYWSVGQVVDTGGFSVDAAGRFESWNYNVGDGSWQPAGTVSASGLTYTKSGESFTRVPSNSAVSGAIGNLVPATYPLTGAMFNSAVVDTGAVYLVVAGNDFIHGNMGGCGFTGTVKNTGRGYSSVVIKMAGVDLNNPDACIFPSARFEGVASFNITTGKFTFITRNLSAPNAIFFAETPKGPVDPTL
jgi:hypothetical protein